jgi:hypothetical protein
VSDWTTAEWALMIFAGAIVVALVTLIWLDIKGNGR